MATHIRNHLFTPVQVGGHAQASRVDAAHDDAHGYTDYLTYEAQELEEAPVA
jgi:hypothetical protein